MLADPQLGPLLGLGLLGFLMAWGLFPRASTLREREQDRSSSALTQPLKSHAITVLHSAD